MGVRSQSEFGARSSECGVWLRTPRLEAGPSYFAKRTQLVRSLYLAMVYEEGLTRCRGLSWRTGRRGRTGWTGRTRMCLDRAVVGRRERNEFRSTLGHVLSRNEPNWSEVMMSHHLMTDICCEAVGWSSPESVGAAHPTCWRIVGQADRQTDSGFCETNPMCQKAL